MPLHVIQMYELNAPMHWFIPLLISSSKKWVDSWLYLHTAYRQKKKIPPCLSLSLILFSLTCPACWSFRKSKLANSFRHISESLKIGKGSGRYRKPMTYSYSCKKEGPWLVENGFQTCLGGWGEFKQWHGSIISVCDI